MLIFWFLLIFLDGAKFLFKVMERYAPGKIFVIGVIHEDTPQELILSSYARSNFPHIFRHRKCQMTVGRRKTYLRLATHNWKFSPSSEILEKIAACEKLRSEEEIKYLALFVYESVMRKVLKEDRKSIGVNPCLEDWNQGLERLGFLKK